MNFPDEDEETLEAYLAALKKYEEGLIPESAEYIIFENCKVYNTDFADHPEEEKGVIASQCSGVIDIHLN